MATTESGQRERTNLSYKVEYDELSQAESRPETAELAFKLSAIDHVHCAPQSSSHKYYMSSRSYQSK